MKIDAMKKLGLIAGIISIGAASLAGLATLSPSASTRAATSAPSLEARVKRLEDRAEIEDLLLQYGRALDHRDFAAYSQLFAADGEWSGSTGTFKGPAQIKAAMEAAFPTPAPGTTPVAGAAAGSSFHLLTNAIIDIDGDRATATSKWTFVRVVDNKPVMALAGRYDDTLIRTGGHWKILRRDAPAATSK